MTPWGQPFRELLSRTGLQDTERDFGLQRSYPMLLQVIPIDHCLVSSHFVALDRHLGPNVGSDHYPLIVELALLK